MLEYERELSSIDKQYVRFREKIDGKEYYLESLDIQYRINVLKAVRTYFERQDKELVDFIDFLIADREAFDSVVMPYVHSSTMTGSNIQHLSIHLSKVKGEYNAKHS